MVQAIGPKKGEHAGNLLANMNGMTVQRSGIDLEGVVHQVHDFHFLLHAGDLGVVLLHRDDLLDVVNVLAQAA